MSTPVFVEGVRTAIDQVFFQSDNEKEYLWWPDSSGTRIYLGDGRYIQPDICGRAAHPSAFSPTSKDPNVIVEDIQTHSPEQSTMLELVQLSRCNHIVVFYFVRPDNLGSKYSYFLKSEKPKLMSMSAVHVLHEGIIYKNGIERFKCPAEADGEEAYQKWFLTVDFDFFRK